MEATTSNAEFDGSRLANELGILSPYALVAIRDHESSIEFTRATEALRRVRDGMDDKEHYCLALPGFDSAELFCNKYLPQFMAAWKNTEGCAIAEPMTEFARAMVLLPSWVRYFRTHPMNSNVLETLLVWVLRSLGPSSSSLPSHTHTLLSILLTTLPIYRHLPKSLTPWSSPPVRLFLQKTRNFGYLSDDDDDDDVCSSSEDKVRRLAKFLESDESFVSARKDALARSMDEGHQLPAWVKCGHEGCEEVNNKELKMCFRCQSVRYCSVEHQAEEWPMHKKSCRAPQWAKGNEV